MHDAIPQEFNARQYRKHNPDLPDLRTKALRQHWQDHGLAANRIASEISNRMQFMDKSLGHCQRMLEIGPFDKPSLERFRKPGVEIEYADYFTTDELRTRASHALNRNPDKVPHIDYCLANGFSQITSKYEAIISHHCVEHQPDLIAHFINVLSALEDSGHYAFTAPHKSYCFDHFIPESTYLEVIVAHLEHRSRPSLRSVLETRCFSRHQYQEALNPFSNATTAMRRCIDAAMNEYASKPYVDVHCWQFTPASLKNIVLNLSILGYLPQLNVRVFCLGAEFGCILSKA